MSLKKKFNPLVKKGFDLIGDLVALWNQLTQYAQDNFAQKDHTHDTSGATIFVQTEDPTINNVVNDGDFWFFPYLKITRLHYDRMETNGIDNYDLALIDENIIMLIDIAALDDMVLYFGLEGGAQIDTSNDISKVYDIYLNNYDASQLEAIYQPQLMTNGILFDGSEFLTTSLFDIASEVTYTFWVNFNSLPTQTGINAGIISKNHSDHNNNTGPGVSVIDENSKNTIHVNYVVNSIWRSFYAPNIDFLTNTWYMISAVITPNSIKLYRDGVELFVTQKQEAPTNIAGLTNSNYMFGARYWNGYQFFLDGILDKVMIFHKALSNSDIQHIYNAQLQ